MSKRMKIMVPLILVFFMIAVSETLTASAEEVKEESFVDCYWNDISEILSMKQDSSFFESLAKEGIYYQYQNNNRASKEIGENVTFFSYDSCGYVCN